MTQAIIARQAGGPEVLELTEAEAPAPGPRQLLVKVAAAGVNFIDTYQRSGIYKVEYPFTPGSESAGTVEAIGAGVEDFAVGDRVATAEGIPQLRGVHPRRRRQSTSRAGRRRRPHSGSPAAAGNDRALSDQLFLPRGTGPHRPDRMPAPAAWVSS